MAPAESRPATAGLGRRLASLLYESLAVLAIVFFAGLVFHAAAPGMQSGMTKALFQLYLFLVLGAYFVLCWTRSGRTLPMQTWKLQLVRSDGAAVGLGRAWWRYLLAWPSLLCCGVGVAWAIFDRDRQFLHDRLAGTRIISVARPTTS